MHIQEKTVASGITQQQACDRLPLPGTAREHKHRILGFNMKAQTLGAQVRVRDSQKM